MQVAEILNEGSGNQYFYVEKPFKVWVHDTYKPSGEHVWSPAGGTAKFHRMTYKQLELKEGDEIHFLVGGLFFILYDKGGKPSVAEGMIEKPSEKSAFEKSYGTYKNPNEAALRKLYDDEKIDNMLPEERAKVKYR